MGLVMMGLSHKTAPVELRERLTVPESRLEGALASLKAMKDVQEAVILSTCNRLEVYARPSAERAPSLSALREFFSKLYDHPRLAPALYQWEGMEAVAHLFRVAAGLDSLVVGES